MANYTFGICLSKLKPTRASVVPYTILNTKRGPKIFFLFGRDRKTGDITDFGGGVKKLEFALNACLREFKEESCEIFKDLYNKANEMCYLIAIADKRMSVLFIPVSPRWLSAPQIFQNKSKPKHKSYNEMSELLWVDEYKFSQLIRNKNSDMWKLLRRFYAKNYNSEVRNALLTRQMIV